MAIYFQCGFTARDTGRVGFAQCEQIVVSYTQVSELMVPLVKRKKVGEVYLGYDIVFLR